MPNRLVPCDFPQQRRTSGEGYLPRPAAVLADIIRRMVSILPSR
jgi:hypothetical protein